MHSRIIAHTYDRFFPRENKDVQMKIAVWRTGHPIADTVAEAILVWLRTTPHGIYDNHTSCLIKENGQLSQSIENADIHIGYGILRGMDKVFHECQKRNKPFILLDRGYWKPGHYDGYYRISLNGTQQTFGFDKLKPDYVRWGALGLDICDGFDYRGPFQRSDTQRMTVLVCPQTEHVRNFFRKAFVYKRTDVDLWGLERIRKKDGQNIPLDFELSRTLKVITFNSSVGWEALRQGIPVISDPEHSIVGAFLHHHGKKTFDLATEEGQHLRRELFATQAALQLRLDEIRAGLLWPLIERLLGASQKRDTAY